MPIPSTLKPGGLWLIAFAATWLFAGVALAQQPPQPDPTGEWLVDKKFARIKIADCDGKMWGVVSWEATPGVDRKNPDPNLRTRPTLGMPILLRMAPGKPNRWDGQIYNSEDGHTYSANITLLDPATLRVQGCFLGFLCGGENWTRVEPEDLPDNAQPRVPQPKTAQAPKTNQTRPGQPNSRKIAAPAPPPAADDVCSSLAGTPGFSH